jgi:hypothetical protein
MAADPALRDQAGGGGLLSRLRAGGNDHRRVGTGGGDALDDRGELPTGQGDRARPVRGAAVGRMVPAHHPLLAGPRLPRGDPRQSRDRCKRGNAGSLIPVTVPEVRRLLAMLLLSRELQQHRLHWSHWRRKRQAEARRSHYQRRLSRSFTHVPL